MKNLITYNEFVNERHSQIYEFVQVTGTTSGATTELKNKIYVLVGPPSVGKSTWVKQFFQNIKPYIINRDVVVEEVAKEFGWTYDDMFMSPPSGSTLNEVSDKYGKIVDTATYEDGKWSWMVWAPLSYDKVLSGNSKIEEKFNKLVESAKGKNNIVIDMTNMNVENRKLALKAIEGSEDKYEKIAVIFNFKGAEEIIKKIAAKRSEEAKKKGQSKTIPDSSFDRMFKSFQEVSDEEGFDKVINVNNIEELKQTLTKN